MNVVVRDRSHLLFIRTALMPLFEFLNFEAFISQPFLVQSTIDRVERLGKKTVAARNQSPLISKKRSVSD